MHYIFIKVRQEDIFMIKFLLEAYDNIMVLSTVDKTIPKLQITVPHDFVTEVESILADMAQRFFIEKLDDDPRVSQGNY